jgi:hypothetical protein
MYYMPVLTVRISEDEKKRLAKRGKLSDAVRDAIRKYLDAEDSKVLFDKLGELQRYDRVTTTPEEIVKMIKEDRYRDSGR